MQYLHDREYRIGPDTVRDVIRFGPATEDRTDPVAWKGNPYAADRGVRIPGWKDPGPKLGRRASGKASKVARRAAAHGCPNVI